MSYTLIRSVVLDKTIGSQWRDQDITLIPVSALYTNYYKIYLELQHISLIDNVFIDMDTLRAQYSNYTGSIVDLLIALGNTALTAIPAIPGDTIRYAKFSDAFRAMYKVDLTVIGQSLPNDYPISLKNDAVLSRPKYDTDLTLLHSHTLITVNGYVHSTDADSSKTYIRDAGKTLRKSRYSTIGILSFLDISPLTKIPITDEILSLQTPGSSYYDKAYIDTGIDLTDKSYFLVVGGYMVFPHANTLEKVNNTTVSFSLSTTPYIERIYESDMSIDISHLEVDRDTDNPTVFNVNQLTSNGTVKKYLTANNSFVVVLDVNHMSFNKIYLRHGNLPGMFTSYQEPVYPLIVNYGRLAEYWSVKEDSHYSVTVNDSFLRDFVIDYSTETDLELINGHLIPMSPNQHSRGYLLEIGGTNI